MIKSFSFIVSNYTYSLSYLKRFLLKKEFFN